MADEKKRRVVKRRRKATVVNTLQEKIDEKIAAMPRQHRNRYRRAMLGKSRKSAIAAACVECYGWEPGAIKAIRQCPSVTCALYPYRPGQRRKPTAEPGQ